MGANPGLLPELCRAIRCHAGKNHHPAQIQELDVDVTTPIPAHLVTGRLTRQQEAARDRALERQARLRLLWTEGVGHSGDHSVWEPYGALTQSIDHDDCLWGAESRCDR